MLLAIKCQAQKTNIRHLKMKLNVLQKDVSDIWTIIRTSGIENLEFWNQTRTDTDNFEDVIEEGKETMNDVKELKTEVKQLILYSKIGLTNEKEFQREAIRDLKRSYRDFQTSLIQENTQIKHNVDRLNKQVSDLQETSKNLQETSKDNQLRIETVNLNQSESIIEIEAHGNFLDSLLKMVEDLSVKQNKLEIENQELKHTISNMKSDLTMLSFTISCDEDWTLFNDHCYLYIDKKQSWDDALATCKSKDSYLVEITSESELEFVAGLKIWFYKRIWIGATDKEHEGKFLYQKNKQAVPTKFWNVGEPNNAEGKEDCVEMIKLDDNKFNDVPCDFVWPFLCEKNGILVAE